MERLCGVAKRRRLCACTSDGVCACIFKKSYYDWIPQRFDDLTDDLLAEILLRLPAKILHRCKSVSKRWLSLISSTSFARSFIRLSSLPANKMLLFKLQHNLPLMGQVYAIPLLHDHLVDNSSLPSSFDFIPPLKPDNYDVNLYYSLNPRKVTDRLLIGIDLVGTYGGLVLLKGEFRDPVDVSSMDKYSPHYYYYYVCNPITKHWVALPVIPASDRVGFTCYYLQQAQPGQNSRIWADAASYDNLIKHNANYDPNKIDFTVVSIKADEDACVFVIHVLSSADEVGQWNIFHVPFPPGWTSGLYGDKAVFANGKFHWCGKNCVAAYDPFCKPLQCDLIPFSPMNPLDDIDSSTFFSLKAFEGSLRLVNAFTSVRLVAWELVDYGNKVWVKIFDVSYDNCGQGHLRFKSFVSAAAKDKVYFVTDPATVMLFDVKNKSFQHFYYPSNLEVVIGLHSVEQFISSSWPTSIPLRASTFTNCNNTILIRMKAHPNLAHRLWTGNRGREVSFPVQPSK